MVYLAARKGGQQLRAREEDHDARPDESFRKLVHRVFEVRGPS